jgi:nicotinamide riboside kinase
MTRIGITGAQSVGKTTLLNALRSEKTLANFQVCDEVTRRVKSYGIPINEDGNDVTQRLIMNEHIYNLVMHEHMITDRTALDGLVYTTYLYKKGKLSKATFDHVSAVFKVIWPKYDYVFYIEPEFDIVDDGVRSTNISFRDEISELFRQTILKERLSLIRVSGSVRNRVDTIIRILEGR